jgi:hypothetical protein
MGKCPLPTSQNPAVSSFEFGRVIVMMISMYPID